MNVTIEIPAESVTVEIPATSVSVDIPAPNIVAKQSFLNQTASLPATTLYTPSEEGDYIVETFAIISAYSGESGTGLVQSEIQATFPSGSKTNFPGVTVQGAPGEGAQGNFALSAIRAEANTPISIITNFGSADPTETYNLYVTVIQI
jgi:hypothetical protein